MAETRFSAQESLDLLVAAELLTGDNKVLDPDLEKKVEATRRCAIQELPDTLIIHLKRFEFDVETLTRTKVRFATHCGCMTTLLYSFLSRNR